MLLQVSQYSTVGVFLALVLRIENLLKFQLSVALIILSLTYFAGLLFTLLDFAGGIMLSCFVYAANIPGSPCYLCYSSSAFLIFCPLK